MKVNVTEEKGFKPVNINLTFESQDEIDAFYALFNYENTNKVIRKYGINDKLIRDNLYSHTLNSQRIHEEVVNNLNNYYRKGK